VRFTRDHPQDSDALSRDPKTTVANDVSRIDAHEPDSTADAGGAQSIESVKVCDASAFLDLIGQAVELERLLERRLQQIDARQHPESYDSHRRYLPEALEPRAPEEIPKGVEADVLEPADDDQMALGLVETMNRYGIHAASQPGFLRMLAGVAEGSTPRQSSKALGNPNYKTQPATAAHLVPRWSTSTSDQR
jgi:hypothetical protein